MCNKCNGICNSCDCTCNKTCTTPDCACKVFITTDCVTLNEDLECSNILKGQTTTEVFKQLDAYICQRFGDIENFFQLVNIGGGSQIYKGISVLGKKELRTLTSNGSVTITQNSDTINLAVNEVEESPLQLIDEGNGEGIILRNRNSDNYANVGFSALDLSKSFSASLDYGAKGQFSAILNGENQEITSISEGSIIGVGFRNYINGKFSSILAGTNGIIDGVGGGVSYLILGGLGNTISESSFIGVSTILNGNLGNINTYYATILNGDSNSIPEGSEYSLIGSGIGNVASEYQSLILQGTDNKASGVNSTVINGNNSEAKGNASIVLNGTNVADSFAEIVGGYFGTTYTPASRTSFNALDRILNIGIGSSDVDRKDGLSLFKNGVLLLPELTISEINSASDKVAITREYLTNYVDGTETKVTAGTNISITGDGSTSTPYVVNNTQVIDGSETKINEGITTTVSGNGTTPTPYIVEVKNNQKVLTYPGDFTGINYTLVDSDFDTLIFVNNGATDVTITVPTGLLEKFYSVFIRQGSGEVSIVSSGTTINTPIGLRINLQNDHICLDKVGSTEVFHLTGNNKI